MEEDPPTANAPFQRLSFRPHKPAVRASHTETRAVTKVLAKYGTSITTAGQGARALFTTGVGQLNNPDGKQSLTIGVLMAKGTAAVGAEEEASLRVM